MTPEAKHAAEIDRVSAVYAALPTAGQRLVDKYRADIERAGRLSPEGSIWSAFAKFIADVEEAFAGTPEKVAGTKTTGSGV